MARLSSGAVDFRRGAVEILGIVFAVLLALWLESWRDDLELEARADAAHERVRAEIETNRGELTESIANNVANIKGIRAVLEAVASDGQDRMPEDLITRLSPHLSISSSSMSDSAWTSAKMTEVLGKIPADKVVQLAALYDTQLYYRDYARFFMREYTDLTIEIQSGEKPLQAAQKFVQHLAILNSIGEQLIGSFDRFLETPQPDEPATGVGAQG